MRDFSTITAVSISAGLSMRQSENAATVKVCYLADAFTSWSSVYGDTESPLRHCKPSPSTSLWPDVHLPNFLTIQLSIRQYIAVYLVGFSMPKLDSWLRHLANPLRRIFQLQ